MKWINNKSTNFKANEVWGRNSPVSKCSNLISTRIILGVFMGIGTAYFLLQLMGMSLVVIQMISLEAISDSLVGLALKTPDTAKVTDRALVTTCSIKTLIKLVSRGSLQVLNTLLTLFKSLHLTLHNNPNISRAHLNKSRIKWH